MTQIIGANRKGFLALGILAVALIAFAGMQIREAGADQYQIPGPTVLQIPADFLPADECELGLGFASQYKYDLEEGQWGGSGAFDSTDLASLGILMNYDQESGILHSWSTDLAVDAVVIKGGGVANAYIYSPEATFGGSANGDPDFGPGIMQAPEVDGPNGSTQKGISHISFCYDRELSVEKTADGDWNEDLDWSITKTVRDANIFVGEDAVFDVDVTLDNTNYIDTVVSGEITVTNGWGIASPATTLQDTVEFGDNSYSISAPVGSLAPGASAIVSYSVEIGTVPSAPAGGTNTVIAAGGSGWGDSASVTVPIAWSSGPNTTFDATVDVYDAFNGGTPELLGTAPSGGLTFPVTVSHLAAGPYNNVACIMDNGVEECANDDVTVHQLSVGKTGAGSYQVDHNWSIEKTVRDANIFVGENAVFDVVVSEDASDDVNVSVSGTISITNPSPDDATISVVDAALVNPTYSENVGSILVPANDTVVVVYTDNRADNSSIADFTNTAFVTNSVGLDVQSASANVSFTAGVPIDATVDVTDNFANTGSSSIGTDAGEYVVTIDGDTLAAGSYNNVACIDSDNGVVECDNVDVTVHQLSVVKTGTAGYQVDNNWLITKSVNDSDIFVGENAVFDVIVSADGSDDVNISVSGTISITNPSSDATTVSLVDAALVNPVYSVGNIAAIAVPGNTTVVVGYTDDRDNNTTTADFTNDAVVTNSIGGDVQTGSVDISFTAGDEIDATVNVYDTFNGGSEDLLGTVSGTGGSFVVTVEDLAAGSYNNVACVSDTGTGAGANDCDDVNVNVYDLQVSKTAGTSFDRTLTYDIAKNVEWWDAQEGEEGAWVYFDGINIPQIEADEAVDVRYGIDVTATVGADADSAHTVAGSITVTNNNPFDDAEIDLTDEISGGGFAVSVLNDSLTIPAGSSVTIEYSELVDGLGEKALDLNSVDIVNNSGNGTDYGATASVSWPDSAGTVLNSSWLVQDTGIVATALIGGVPTQLGEIAAENLLLGGDVTGTAGINGGTGHVTIGGSLNALLLGFQTHNGAAYCNDVVWSNTATVFALGTDVSSTAAIVVDQSCEQVLTRTPGYWKTHNDTFNGGDDKGGPVTDPTWYTVGPLAEQEEFLGSGQTWYGVLWNSDAGNPWNTLARHYAAAAMNVAAGTSTTDLVGVYLSEDWDNEDVMALALSLLTDPGSFEITNNTGLADFNPDTNAPWTRKELRSQGIKGKVVSQYVNSFAIMLLLADYIDGYNNGIVGPGHGD